MNLFSRKHVGHKNHKSETNGQIHQKHPVEEIFTLAEQVEYLPGQVVSRTISQNDAQSLTIFAFDKGEEISTHSSHGDAMITVLDGEEGSQ